MNVHLEGFGVLGSFIAWELERLQVPFTWHDNEEKVCAWRACTGAIFPTGEASDAQGMAGWRAWLAGGATWAAQPPLRECLESATWWYSTKAPPHGAKGKPVADLGALRRLSEGSLHFNAQQFVPRSRAYFADRRRAERQPGLRVVAHGFGERLDHVVWGWSRLVRLEGDARIFGDERPALYCRLGRFVMAYAYPVPATPYWYAGSSLIVQKAPRSLEMPKKYERWRRQFESLTGGLVQVVEESDFLMGWRPAAAKGDEQLAVLAPDGSVVVRPMWHNGVRLAPLIVAEVTRLLGVG